MLYDVETTVVAMMAVVTVTALRTPQDASVVQKLCDEVTTETASGGLHRRHCPSLTASREDYEYRAVRMIGFLTSTRQRTRLSKCCPVQ